AAGPCVPAGCVRLDGGAGDGVADEAQAGLPPVLGDAAQLIALASRHRFTLALVSEAGLPGAQASRLMDLLARLEVPAVLVPGVERLLIEAAGAQRSGGAGEAGGESAVRRPARRHGGAERLDLSALIGRTHYGLDPAQVGRIITGKRVLITGAGGSIGSELARVVAGFGPECVVLMERAENNLFSIDHHLARQHPLVARRAVLHDVVDSDQTLRLLAQHRPHVVFHAAAHKHVPLMEDHPGHAVNNNLFGTKSIADASLAAGVERFVMISSDKAVNPTSVMGATKRLAEIYVASLARSQPATQFGMVRFGNVLGSAGSVLPLWQQQLDEGHAVTVTDPRMTRYFMTIPEAAALVVQAGALEQPAGEAPVYVLDMGQPVRILELALRFVRLNGCEPVIDEATLPAAARGLRLAELAGGSRGHDEAPAVPVVFTGARPGEKLYEELSYSAEHLRPTAHRGINQWAADGAGLDTASVMRMIADMSALRTGAASKGAVLAALRQWVPEMTRTDGE
ncbi:MAG: polysaccharide biosynthesis protein, partial [Phycisphaeraceae bacterium]|nr:polysaccharide biosynthesis protein [Phycisphaeraceae bacterium]